MSDKIKPRIPKRASQQEIAPTDAASIILDVDKAAEAFESYYYMGIDRTLEQLSISTRIPYEAISQWNEAFGWLEKIHNRDADKERIFEERYLNRSRNIRNRIVNQMEDLLKDMENNSLGLPFVIRDINDFRSLSQAYESLARANSLVIKKSQDNLAAGEAPTTWADLLHSVEGDGVED